MFLFVDVETSGMPEFGRDKPADDPSQPHIVQISARLLDGALLPMADYQAIVQPDGWISAPEALAVHGITHERAMAEGRPIAEVMHEVDRLFASCRVIAGYHLRFDNKLLRGERRRLGRPDQYGQRREFDVMWGCQKVIGGRQVKLSAAVQQLLGREHDGAHDADADNLATIDLARVLRDQHQIDIRGKWPRNFEWMEKKEGAW